MISCKYFFVGRYIFLKLWGVQTFLIACGDRVIIYYKLFHSADDIK